ncbi:MAG: hypothetical protein WC411_04365 [Bacilli bacterium]
MRIVKILSIGVFVAVLLTGCNAGGNNFYAFNDKPETSNLYQARKAVYRSDMPRSGNARVLVVPIEFSDYSAESLLRGAEGAHEDLRKVYFGEPEETQWESLKSYYEKSSYGKVTVSGQIMPWYRPLDHFTGEWLSTQELLDKYGTGNNDSGIARTILGEIYSDYMIKLWQNVTDDEGNPYPNKEAFAQDYDGDGDGYIDVIQMVYSAPIQHLDSDLFWAFRSADTSAAPLKTRPQVCGFVWLGYDFIYENGYFDELDVYHDWSDEQIASGEAKVDAHTIIHESGHAFGADDYYTYDDNDWGALGGTDMMDYNVGDHNAFTKGIFGWADPVVVTGPTTIDLKSFTDTGEMIVLPAYRHDKKVNNSLLDNYLLIEYYRPIGLNAMDATYNYSGNYPKMPNVAGIRVYHVDARLGLFSYNSASGDWDFIRYVSNVSGTDSNSYIGIANSNTKSFSSVAANKLIHALEVSGLNTLKSAGAVYSSSMMWQEGDTFGYDTFVNFTLNNSEKLGYKFEISDMSDESATIKFSRA